MDFSEFKSLLKEYIPKPVDNKKEYAVAIPLYFNRTKDRWEILYEVRSKHINQPSEISFPGGRVEDGESYAQAAIRETQEELNIKEENIVLLGELDYIVTPGKFIIKSFLVGLKDIDPYLINYNEDEVESIFTVPLGFFLNTKPLKSIISVRLKPDEGFPYDLIPNGKRYNFAKGRNVVLFYRYKKYIIWGFTAKLTRRFIEIYAKKNGIIKEEDKNNRRIL